MRNTSSLNDDPEYSALTMNATKEKKNEKLKHVVKTVL